MQLKKAEPLHGSITCIARTMGSTTLIVFSCTEHQHLSVCTVSGCKPWVQSNILGHCSCTTLYHHTSTSGPICTACSCVACWSAVTVDSTAVEGHIAEALQQQPCEQWLFTSWACCPPMGACRLVQHTCSVDEVLSLNADISGQ